MQGQGQRVPAQGAPPPPPPPPPPGGNPGMEGTNWLDAAPGVSMEYKVHVDAAKEDCYYQYVHPGATLYVSYQVQYPALD